MTEPQPHHVIGAERSDEAGGFPKLLLVKIFREEKLVFAVQQVGGAG